MDSHRRNLLALIAQDFRSRRSGEWKHLAEAAAKGVAHRTQGNFRV